MSKRLIIEVPYANATAAMTAAHQAIQDYGHVKPGTVSGDGWRIVDEADHAAAYAALVRLAESIDATTDASEPVELLERTVCAELERQRASHVDAIKLVVAFRRAVEAEQSAWLVQERGSLGKAYMRARRRFSKAQASTEQAREELLAAMGGRAA